MNLINYSIELNKEEKYKGEVSAIKDFGVFVSLYKFSVVLLCPHKKYWGIYKQPNVGDVVEVVITGIRKKDTKKINGRIIKIINRKIGDE